jgi:hypothetical protein
VDIKFHPRNGMTQKKRWQRPEKRSSGPKPGKRKLPTIKDEWDEYRKLLPEDAYPIQIVETRRAFYAGAWSLWSIVKELGEDDFDLNQGAAILELLRLEIKAFQTRIGKDV